MQDNFEHLNSLSPIVTVAQNFDDLGKVLFWDSSAWFGRVRKLGWGGREL